MYYKKVPLVGVAFIGNSELPLFSSLFGYISILLDALVDSSRIIALLSILMDVVQQRLLPPTKKRLKLGP